MVVLNKLQVYPCKVYWSLAKQLHKQKTQNTQAKAASIVCK